MILYENALQVLPVLMIALFLDTRATASGVGERQRSAANQGRLYILLCVGAFAVSLSVISGLLVPGRVTQAVVLGALMGCTVLLAALAWRRSGRGVARRRS